MLVCAACHNQNDDDQRYCQSCGAALSVPDNEDDLALSLMMGLVCPSCDSYNDPGTSHCVVCSAALDAPPAGGAPAAPADPPAWMQAPAGKPISTHMALPKVSLDEVTARGAASLAAPEGSQPPSPAVDDAPTQETPASDVPGPDELPTEFSTQACVKCSADLAPADKFCRVCGTPVGAPAPAGTLMMAAQKLPPPATPPPGAGATMMMPSLGQVANAPAPSATMFFGAATVQRFARLSLIKGHTQFGTQWRLQAGETVVGRNAGMVLFPEDAHLGDPHFRVVFEDDGLYLDPVDEKNGVFVALRGPEPLAPGTEFIIGVQRLRYLDAETLPRSLPLPPPGETPLLGSMMRDAELLCLERVFADPRLSETYVRPQRILTLGRRRCDVNFPADPYMSTRHAEVVREDSGVLLRDLQSRNGTFLRIHQRRKLQHGDAIMFGEQVLRVEVQG